MALQTSTPALPAPILPRNKLAELAADDESLRPYVRLLELALEACEDPRLATAVEGLIAAPSDGQPLLHGSRLLLPRRQMEALWLALGGDERDLLVGLRNALELRDGDTILQLTLLPVLHAARRKLIADASWQAGICPVCAAWPALAESRGLDRARMLRCGRCEAEWQLPWQLCPFCANADHASLAYLYSDGTGEARRVFVCERCKGYLKTLATLSRIDEVPVEDLASLDLDLAALDAGYQRPEQPGFDLQVQLVWKE